MSKVFDEIAREASQLSRELRDLQQRRMGTGDSRTHSGHRWGWSVRSFPG